MRNFFRHYFIPHQGNDHKPHVLRVEATLIILSVILVAETAFLLQSFVITRQTDFFAAILPGVLVDQTNMNRGTADLGELSVSPLLEEAARRKAEDMAKNGYFAHTSPDGKSPWYWLTGVGYRFAAAGENLAVNFIDSGDVTEAWMNSVGHRANILNSNFSEIGIAAARGTYKGRETVFVVQFFGRPIPQVAGAGTDVPAPQGLQVALTEPEAVPETELDPGRHDEELFIEVESVPFTEEPEAEAAGEKNVPAQSSSIERLLAKPHTTVDIMLIVLATIVALALTLKVFIRMDIQHPPLVVNGVLLLIIISSAILVNRYFSLLGAEIV